MRPLINYNRKTGLFDAAFDGITIASGSSYLAADTSAKTYLLRVLAQLIMMLTFPEPTPPAAPAAKKPKAKKTKAACICPSCIPQQMGDDMLMYVDAALDNTPANGVKYCLVDKEWAVYLNGFYARSFPKKEIRDAQDYFNNLRTESIRRRAA